MILDDSIKGLSEEIDLTRGTFVVLYKHECEEILKQLKQLKKLKKLRSDYSKIKTSIGILSSIIEK